MKSCPNYSANLVANTHFDEKSAVFEPEQVVAGESGDLFGGPPVAINARSSLVGNDADMEVAA